MSLRAATTGSAAMPLLPPKRIAHSEASRRAPRRASSSSVAAARLRSQPKLCSSRSQAGSRRGDIERRAAVQERNAAGEAELPVLDLAPEARICRAQILRHDQQPVHRVRCHRPGREPRRKRLRDGRPLRSFGRQRRDLQAVPEGHVRHGQTSAARLARAMCNGWQQSGISIGLPSCAAQDKESSATSCAQLARASQSRAADEARRVESVEPGQLFLRVWHMERQGAQIPVGGQPVGGNPAFARRNGYASKLRGA